MKSDAPATHGLNRTFPATQNSRSGAEHSGSDRVKSPPTPSRSFLLHAGKINNCTRCSLLSSGLTTSRASYLYSESLSPFAFMPEGVLRLQYADARLLKFMYMLWRTAAASPTPPTLTRTTDSLNRSRTSSKSKSSTGYKNIRSTEAPHHDYHEGRDVARLSRRHFHLLPQRRGCSRHLRMPLMPLRSPGTQ